MEFIPDSMKPKEPSIHEVILQGQVWKAKDMITADEKLLKKTDEGERLPIHWAASMGLTELLEFIFLKDSKLDVDAGDDRNLTPLIIAASAGRTEVVKLLIHKGADINHQCSGGHSALQYAASKNHLEIVELLLAHNANVNIADGLSATPLHRAASKGNTKIVKLLLDKGVQIDVNPRDSSGNTPLHLACEEDRVEEAKMLVHYGADIYKENKSKKTPLDFAKEDLANVLKNIAETR